MAKILDLAMLSDMGINVVESDEQEEGEREAPRRIHLRRGRQPRGLLRC